MTPKEIVLSGYQCFAEGDMEGLGKIFHANALIKCNGGSHCFGVIACGVSLAWLKLTNL